MKEKMKHPSFATPGKILSKNELKRIIGGAQCIGNYCVGTGMPCTQTPLTPAICQYFFPSVPGQVAPCRVEC